MKFFWAFWLTLAATTAVAHEPSRSFLDLRSHAEDIEARLDLPLAELHHAVGLDPDGDGRITWSELEASRALLDDLVVNGLTISIPAGPCIPEPARLAMSDRQSGPHAVLQWSVACPGRSAPLIIDWSLFNTFNPQHQGIIRLIDAQETLIRVAAADGDPISLNPQSSSRSADFLVFLEQGIIHIFEGVDHWLFVITLLLPAVLWRHQGQGWQPAAGAGDVVLTVAKIVTAFTIAHSLTLALASLKLVDLPGRWIEAAIAATVVLAALNNIWPVVTRRIWLVAFGFGLIHGFGFANVLQEIDLATRQFAIALLGFNLGVEAGQLILVALVLPLLLAARHQAFYARWAMPAASAAILLLGLLWLGERTFGTL